MARIKLIASEGKVYTNGTAAGRIIYLSESDDTNNWYEILESEYEAKLTEQATASLEE
jgi:hypothetical protein